MNSLNEGSAIDVLLAARLIADRAKSEGAIADLRQPRITSNHMGAIVADAVLQAGLNYSTVVRPRVLKILRRSPESDTVSALDAIVKAGEVEVYLDWYHQEKVRRFEALVELLRGWGIDTAADLKNQLLTGRFCLALQGVNGIGPKTVDYMACLVGIESIAVDRHVRAFAQLVGIERCDYYFLKRSFCCAADLLSVPRREFDAWLWKRAVGTRATQMVLNF